MTTEELYPWYVGGPLDGELVDVRALEASLAFQLTKRWYVLRVPVRTLVIGQDVLELREDRVMYQGYYHLDGRLWMLAEGLVPAYINHVVPTVLVRLSRYPGAIAAVIEGQLEAKMIIGGARWLASLRRRDTKYTRCYTALGVARRPLGEEAAHAE